MVVCVMLLCCCFWLQQGFEMVRVKNTPKHLSELRRWNSIVGSWRPAEEGPVSPVQHERCVSPDLVCDEESPLPDWGSPIRREGTFEMRRSMVEYLKDRKLLNIFVRRMRRGGYSTDHAEFVFHLVIRKFNVDLGWPGFQRVFELGQGLGHLYGPASYGGALMDVHDDFNTSFEISDDDLDPPPLQGRTVSVVRTVTTQTVTRLGRPVSRKVLRARAELERLKQAHGGQTPPRVLRKRRRQ